jgi:hypothetical protein
MLEHDPELYEKKLKVEIHELFDRDPVKFKQMYFWSEARQ